MLDKAWEYTKQLIALKGQVDKNTSDLKELSNDLKQLTTLVRDLAESNRELRTLFNHLKETEKSERENLRKDFQSLEREQHQSQENLLLKLQIAIQEAQLSRLPRHGDSPQLPEGHDKPE
jgi:chromosome segregation ATPase